MKNQQNWGGHFPYPPCKFNPAGVVCESRNKCEKCGWNPAVEHRRKQAIRQKWLENFK